MKTWVKRGLIAGLLVGMLGVFFGRELETTEELYAHHADEVVKVIPMFKAGALLIPWGHGSGILLNSRGYVLTAGHVASHGIIFLIGMKSGKTYSASLLATDRDHDLAILQPMRPQHGLRAAVLGTALHVGTQVAHIGCPLDFDWAMTSGLVSWMKDRVLLTDTVVAPGSSGGALYNRYGEIVGLAVAVLTENDAPVGYTLFTNMRDIRHFLGGWEGVL